MNPSEPDPVVETLKDKVHIMFSVISVGVASPTIEYDIKLLFVHLFRYTFFLSLYVDLDLDFFHLTSTVIVARLLWIRFEGWLDLLFSFLLLPILYKKL